MSVPAEVEDLITGEALSAHFATAVDERPHVAPVWYAYDDGVLSVLTGGRKLANCRRNPRVAISIEKLDDGAPTWMVAMQGTTAVIEDSTEVQSARERIYPKYDDPDYRADGGDDGEGGEGGALIEITIGSATAHRY